MPEALAALLRTTIPDIILEEWQRQAREHTATGFYASWMAFQWLFPYQGNEWSTALQHMAPYAYVLEYGHDGYHLPEKIDWGAAEARGKAKRTKDGRRYLNIPLRHYSPGSASGGIASGRARAEMSASAYALAVKMNRSREAYLKAQEAFARTGRKAVRGNRWMSKAYSLPTAPSALRDRAIAKEGHPGYTWRSPELQGLTQKTQVSPSGVRSSTYTTFRTLMEDSVGWYIPPMQGYGFAAKTREAIKPAVEEAVGTAARQDVADIIAEAFAARGFTS